MGVEKPAEPLRSAAVQCMVVVPSKLIGESRSTRQKGKELGIKLR
jgi:hypothetical protein